MKLLVFLYLAVLSCGSPVPPETDEVTEAVDTKADGGNQIVHTGSEVSFSGGGQQIPQLFYNLIPYGQVVQQGIPSTQFSFGPVQYTAIRTEQVPAVAPAAHVFPTTQVVQSPPQQALIPVLKQATALTPVKLPDKIVQTPVTGTSYEFPIQQQIHYGTVPYVAGSTTTFQKPSISAPQIAPPAVFTNKVSTGPAEVMIHRQPITVDKVVPNLVEIPFDAGTFLEYTEPQIKKVSVPQPVVVHEPVEVPVPQPAVYHVAPAAVATAAVAPAAVAPAAVAPAVLAPAAVAAPGQGQVFQHVTYQAAPPAVAVPFHGQPVQYFTYQAAPSALNIPVQTFGFPYPVTNLAQAPVVDEKLAVLHDKPDVEKDD